MSLFSRDPKSIDDLEKAIAKLRGKKRLSEKDADRLADYERRLDELKAAEEADRKKQARNKKLTLGAIAVSIIILIGVIFSGCISDEDLSEPVDTEMPTAAVTESVADPAASDDSSQPAAAPAAASESSSAFSLSSVPDYSGSPYVAVNNNVPYFTQQDYTTESYEYYSPLDSLGRCGVCVASIGRDLMPTEERGSIGSVKPTGWHTVKYDNVDGKYLYNRCHLIGYQLSGENANTRNLITGTRYLNVQGMLPFENMVADYVKETGNHVLYRSTPIFSGSNLLASGVLLEAYSVEDSGDGICFNVYCYNVQPGVSIDYANGDSYASAPQSSSQSATQPAPYAAPQEQNEPAPAPDQGTTGTYILNTNTKKFHLPGCSSVKKMSEQNKQTYNGSRGDLISQGYEPCKKCNP